MEQIDEKTGDKLTICDKCGEITHRWTKQGVIGKPNVHQCQFISPNRPEVPDFDRGKRFA
jgi:hypothetical protein